jgi:hypothetical protein
MECPLSRRPCALPVGQLGLDVRERDPARLQHHQQMIDEIGALRDQPLAILADGGKRGLDRLLAQLLGAMGDAAVEQLAGIGQVGARLGALLDPFLQVFQGEIGHSQAPVHPP